MQRKYPKDRLCISWLESVSNHTCSIRCLLALLMCTLFLENYMYIPSLVKKEKVVSSFQTCGSGINLLKLWDVQGGQQQASKLSGLFLVWNNFPVSVLWSRNTKSNLLPEEKNILVYTFSQQPSQEFAWFYFYLTCLAETKLV